MQVIKDEFLKTEEINYLKRKSAMHNGLARQKHRNSIREKRFSKKISVSWLEGPKRQMVILMDFLVLSPSPRKDLKVKSLNIVWNNRGS